MPLVINKILWFNDNNENHENMNKTNKNEFTDLVRKTQLPTSQAIQMF